MTDQSMAPCRKRHLNTNKHRHTKSKAQDGCQTRTEQNRTLLITIHLRPLTGGVNDKCMHNMKKIDIIHTVYYEIQY